MSTLETEKKDISFLEDQLEIYLNKMDASLKELNGIENKLYYEIIVKGINVTKAVDKVAFAHDKEISTVWKNYYPKVKKTIEKLKESQINIKEL